MSEYAYLVGPCCCKCCITLKYRIWVAAHGGGLGGVVAFEWELSDGQQTLSGVDHYIEQGVYAYAGDFSFYNQTDTNPQLAPFHFPGPNPNPAWMSPDPADIDLQCQADEIAIRFGNSTFCGDTGRNVNFTGADNWTETVHLVWGTASDLPDADWWDSHANYKYGVSQWHETELCEA